MGRTRYPVIVPQGRLTLTTAVAVTLTDVTAATTIYYTPYVGEMVSIRGNNRMIPHTFAQLSLALDATGAHTGDHEANSLFDVFAFINSSGDVDIGTGPKWTDATTRAEALARIDGLMVNDSEIQLRTGSGADDLETVAAHQATYLGTFRTVAAGQTEDSFAKRFVWNAYNRVDRAMRVFPTTNTWAGSAAATFRQAEAAAGNQLAFVRGLDEDAVHAQSVGLALGSGATVREIRGGIGLDATDAIAAGCVPGYAGCNNATVAVVASSYRGLPGLGYHFLAWLEMDHASDTRTYYGDNNAPLTTQSGIHGTVRG